MKTIKFSLILSITSLLIIATTASTYAAFTDVPPSHKYYTAITYLEENGVIKGYEDGSFRPDAKINRAELMKILVEGKGISPDNEIHQGCFPDVQSEWFARYVCYAKKQGWVSGYPNGLFQPANDANEAEALKMIINSQGIDISEFTQSDGTLVASVGNLLAAEWFVPYQKTAEYLIITGDQFRPSLPATRGVVASYIHAAIGTEGGSHPFDRNTIVKPMQRFPTSTEPILPEADITNAEKFCQWMVPNYPSFAGNAGINQNFAVVTTHHYMSNNRPMCWWKGEDAEDDPTSLIRGLQVDLLRFQVECKKGRRYAADHCDADKDSIKQFGNGEVYETRIIGDNVACHTMGSGVGSALNNIYMDYDPDKNVEGDEWGCLIFVDHVAPDYGIVEIEETKPPADPGFIDAAPIDPENPDASSAGNSGNNSGEEGNNIPGSEGVDKALDTNPLFQDEANAAVTKAAWMKVAEMLVGKVNEYLGIVSQ